MKKTISILLFLASIALVSFSKPFYPSVQYEGIYVYKIDTENSAVIRFYADGIVLVSTSVNDYSKVMTWFNRDKENLDRVLTGKYKTGKRNQAIRFDVKGETGEQKFTGFIMDNKTLQLHVFNPKDKTSTDRTYNFINPASQKQ